MNYWFETNQSRPSPSVVPLTHNYIFIDSTGAPGCEPGMVSFSCDPQLEEELVSVICSLELLFTKNRRNKEIDVDYEVGCCADIVKEMSLNLNCENNLRSVFSPKDRTPHSVHSCGYITDFKRSDDELSGYLTNWKLDLIMRDMFGGFWKISKGLGFVFELIMLHLDSWDCSIIPKQNDKGG